MKLTEEHHKWIAESTPTEGTSSAEKAHWILGAEEAIQKFGGIQWNKYPEVKPPQMQTRVLMVNFVNFDRIWREGMARDGRLFTYNSSAGVWVRTTATHWARINLPNQ